jgi:hypothetical protein
MHFKFYLMKLLWCARCWSLLLWLDQRQVWFRTTLNELQFWMEGVPNCKTEFIGYGLWLSYLLVIFWTNVHRPLDQSCWMVVLVLWNSILASSVLLVCVNLLVYFTVGAKFSEQTNLLCFCILHIFAPQV